MTPIEREKLVKDMAQAIKDAEWIDSIEQAAAALAIAERRIREDCVEIAEKHAGKGTYENVGVVAAIRASIQESKL